MELKIPLSTDPLNGFARTAKVIRFDWSIENSFIKLNTWAEYSFDAKSEKQTSRIKNYEVDLVCDNTAIVDPKTGEFVMVNENGVALQFDPKTNEQLPGIGQYDFYVGIAQQGPVDIIGLIKMLVLRADSLKRYDV